MELRRAARRNDLTVIRAAAGLLGPTVAACALARPAAANPAETAALCTEIQALLAECEAALAASRQGVAAKMKRVVQGRRVLAQVRSREAARSAGRGVLLQ